VDLGLMSVHTPGLNPGACAGSPLASDAHDTGNDADGRPYATDLLGVVVR
jgi:hypothetical protein